MAEQGKTEVTPAGFVLAMIAPVPTVLVGAWALGKVWGWYLAERFGPITFYEAVGVCLVAAVLATKRTGSIKLIDASYVLSSFIAWTLCCVTLVAIAYVLSAFIL